MDIASTDTKPNANSGAVLELRSPTGGKLLQADHSPVTLTLLGADSDTYVKLSHSFTDSKFKKGFRPGSITSEGSLEEQIDLLAACTVAWSGIGLGEDSTPLTKDAAKKLYRIAYIRDQAQEFITDRGNFSKA